MLSADRCAPHPMRVPFVAGDRIPWVGLMPRRQEQVREWLTALNLDPARVPVGGLVQYDPTTHEWRVEVWALRGGARYVRPDGRIATCVVRRRDRRRPQ